jgi:hypothetical protein
VTHRSRVSTLIAAAVVVLCQLSMAPATAAPEPGPDRALFGGVQNLMAKESSLGRTLDLVRVYSVWKDGPPPVPPVVSTIMSGGDRTVLLSASIPWHGWAAQAKKLNNDGNAGNDVPEPYCATKPTIPGSSTPSGKTWFGAVATGDYDDRLRTWLQRFSDLASQTPAAYISFQHEADRLGDVAKDEYQQCVGTPAEYRAAWNRIRLIAEGVRGPGGEDLTRRSAGRLVLVPIYTTWGFWHTETNRVLIRPVTGEPNGTTDADKTLESARVTPWVPASEDYDVLAADTFNYSGTPAGGGVPVRVQVDDPATATKEADKWRSLRVLVRPVVIWADHHATMPNGSVRPLMLAEYGSVPDPTRPDRRPQWIADACRFLSDPVNARFHAASYFDVNQMRLTTWNWTKLSSGAWSAASTPTGTDTRSVAALAEMGASARFSGSTNPC